MPREYEAIRDSLEAQGKPAKTAKRIAAATYNSRHPKGPFVTGHSEGHPGRMERLAGRAKSKAER